MKIFHTFFNIKKNLSLKLQRKLNISLILIIVASFTELFSISAVIGGVSFALNEHNNTLSFLSSFKNVDPYFIIFFIFIVYLIKTLILILILNYHTKFTSKIGYYFSSKLLVKYVNLDYGNFIQDKTATYIRNITTDIVRINSFLYHTLYLVNELLVILILSVLIFFIDPITFLILLVTSVPFILIYINYTRKNIYNVGQEIRNIEEKKLFISQQVFFGFKLIKHFEIKNFFLKNFIKNESYLATRLKFIAFISGIPRYFIDLVIVSVLLILLIVNLAENRSSNEVILVFSAFAAAGLRIAPSISRILVAIQGIKVSLSSAEYFLENILKYNKKKIIKKNIIALNRDLEVMNASFKFDNDEKYLFKNLNIKISKNSIIGIKGETGSGKSTLVNCLVGQLKFTEGGFYNDSKKIHQENISCHNIGLVHQDTFLLNDSIKRNIAVGVSDNLIDHNKLINAIKIANIADFVNSLQDKENTIISENSTNISGGQKQRICIARAIYFQQQLLILDEATNALDETTENTILNEICSIKNNFTIIIVSHNDKVLKKCDQIIDLKNYK